MKLVIGSDHAGFQLKVTIGDLLRSLGHEVLDVGASTKIRRTIRISRKRSAARCSTARAERGVLICGSGVGASVAANKITGYSRGNVPRHLLRRIKVWSTTTSMCWCWARASWVTLAQDLVKAFLGAKFTNEERHVRRLGKVKAIEAKYCGEAK